MPWTSATTRPSLASSVRPVASGHQEQIKRRGFSANMPIAYLPSSSPCVSALLRERPGVVGTVFFNFSPQAAAQGPVLAHIPGRAPEQPTKAGSAAKEYFYPAAGEFFVVPGHANYHPASAGLAHTRSLSFLKPLLGGPIFDIEAVWEEHTLYEFGERDVDKTMATMVEQPSVSDPRAATHGVETLRWFRSTTSQQ